MLHGHGTRSLFQHPAPNASSFQRHNILCEEQHDFRSGRSCETQLLIQSMTLLKTLMIEIKHSLILVRHSTVTVFSTLLHRNNIVTTIMI